MRALWAGTVVVCLGFGAAARADEIQWRPASPRRAVPASTSQAADRSSPVATLGIPTPLKVDAAPAAPTRDENLSRTGYSSSTSIPYTARGQGPDASPPTLAPPVNALNAGPEERYNCGVANDPPPGGGGGGGGGNFFGKCKDWFTHIEFGGKTADRCLFQSVHSPDMDQFASPVSDPFFFEDPRTLTEVRPIFIFQQAPGSSYAFRGGNMEYFGIQARLAITERFSVVVNKLGGIWQQPNDNVLGLNNQGGFAELWLGPKYTFYRCDETRTVAAGGLTFQVPIGSSNTFQNTGTLSLVPYVTAAQNFLRSSYGSFNIMDTLGYAFSTNNVRSDYFYNSLHLDYNVLNANKIYPLIEMSYLNYTRSGTANPVDFEGRDLFNFGATDVNNRNSLTLSTGARYKFNEAIQTGFTIGTPIIAPRDLYAWRLTFDLIFRY